MYVPKLLKEKVLMKRYGKKVIERYFKYPKGKVEEFFLFKGKTPVIIFPLTKNGEVIATQQFRHGANKFVLEVPGGVIKKREDRLQTVKRELAAETGYVPTAIRLLGPRIWFDPASFTVSFYPYLALNCRKEKKRKLDRTEVMKTVLVPLKDWIKMVLRPKGFRRRKIIDDKTITLTFLALPHLGVKLTLNGIPLERRESNGGKMGGAI